MKDTLQEKTGNYHITTEQDVRDRKKYLVLQAYYLQSKELLEGLEARLKEIDK